MAIRLTTPNGLVFEVDTVAEALALQRGQGTLPPDPSPAKKTRKRNGNLKPRREREPEPAATIHRARIRPSGLLSEGSIRLLRGLQRMGSEELKTPEFAELVGVRPKQLPPLFMQLRKEIRKVDIPMEAVVTRRKIYVRGRAKSVYAGGPSIVEALKRAQRGASPLS